MFAIALLMIGCILLVLCVAAGRHLGKPASKRRGALWFLPMWLLATGFNLWLGVSGGGGGGATSVAEELPMFALVFGIPAAIAGLVAWKSS